MAQRGRPAEAARRRPPTQRMTRHAARLSMEPAASLPDLPMPTACPWDGYARRYRILVPKYPIPRLASGGEVAARQAGGQVDWGCGGSGEREAPTDKPWASSGDASPCALTGGLCDWRACPHVDRSLRPAPASRRDRLTWGQTPQSHKPPVSVQGLASPEDAHGLPVGASRSPLPRRPRPTHPPLGRRRLRRRPSGGIGTPGRGCRRGHVLLARGV